ncbi:MAG TPA: hypothetical protein VJU61_28960, partial [Polyangiaceae bacterium]|nr:hypothetical protein [Polyangiaceae bacterium]
QVPSSPFSEAVSAPSTSHVTGRLRCNLPSASGNLGFATLELPDYGTGRMAAKPDGSFDVSVSGAITDPQVRVRVQYEGTVTTSETINGSASAVSSFIQVMDELHDSRSEELQQTGSLQSDGTLSLRDVTFNSLDCELYRIGVKVLTDHHRFAQQPPPGGALRVLRWSAVNTGIPYAFYDYVNIRTDLLTAGNYAHAATRENMLFHEFGHVVRDLADGDLDHWNWDNFRWAYARKHLGGEIFNQQFAFHEGWGDYYAQARFLGHATPAARRTADNLDWNEDLIAQRLLYLAGRVKQQLGVGDDAADRVMVDTLRANPGTIHSIYEFELALALRLGIPPFRPQPPPCPPGYTNDGATCRLSSIVNKASSWRGVGQVPNQCGAGEEYDAGLCYPACREGYHGAGPFCWQSCPDGYRDDGADCWGGVLDILWKDSYGRGAGSVPSSCGSGEEYDAGLCYPACAPGYHGVGPTCWGDCPADYQDDGATCSLTSILVRF